MIKKLRWKFIFINMICVTSILFIVFGFFYFLSSNRLTEQTKMALLPSVKKEHLYLPFTENTGIHNRQTPPPIPSFSVTLNPDGSISTIEENNMTVTSKLASDLIETISSDNLTEGVLTDYHLRFLKSNTPNGITVNFADQSYEITNRRILMLHCILFYLGAVFLFFILSLYLSILALKPVEIAWNQQNQFLADASHELKTPLTVILANIDIMGAHEDSTIFEQKKWLHNTKEEATRMKQLLEHLLFLTRSNLKGEEGNIKSERTTMNFSNLVLKSSLSFESIAFENQVILLSQIERGILLSGWEAQIKQVITILLDNACKYAGKDGTVSIELKKSNSFAILSVSNSGETIPLKEQKYIFQRFYRTDKSRSRKEGGYGLGLAIAKSIVEDHKGTIHVSSTPKEGTTFTVTLPI